MKPTSFFQMEDMSNNEFAPTLPSGEPIQLRDYQINFIRQIFAKLLLYVRILAVMATGGGKTVVFLSLTAMAIKAGKTVLLITESTNIFPQIASSCSNAIEINAGIKNVPLAPGNIYVAMAQTLVRRPEMVDFFNSLGKELIIITDEAHIGTATKLLLQMQQAYHIGFTATPDSRVAKHLTLLFDGIAVGPQAAGLVEEEHLSPCTQLTRTKLIDLSSLQKDKGEFTEKSQEQALDTPDVQDKVKQDLKNITYTKCLVFTASINHCERLTEQLNSDGFPAVAVHSLADPDAIQAFKHGNINICVSVGKLTKGFDYPPIDLVVLLRATTSLPLYLQMIGRASRTCAGKTGFTVLDYGDNWKRHGLWITDRDWERMWKGKIKESGGTAPVKDCPTCECIINISSSVCPHCGHEFQKERALPESYETELIDITRDYNSIKGKNISTLTPQQLAVYAKITGKKHFAFRIAKAQYQAGNDDFIHAFGRAMGYKNGWALYQVAEVEITEEVITFHDITIK